MKNYLILILTCLAFGYAQAQSTVARLKYEDAEKAFYDEDYQSCIRLLDETEKLLGQSAPNILHLRIIAESKIWEADPYASYEQLEKLHKLCDQYLKNYDIQGLEEKYREVYDFSTKLPKTGSQAELQPLRKQYLLQLNEERNKEIISKNNLAYVEGGTFTMGQKKEAHEVTVSDFYMGKYEVTIDEYQRFILENPDYQIRSMVSRDCPIGDVKWQEAMDYCKWLEKQYGGIWRLPTEAEWEYAAIGGKHHTPETYDNMKFHDYDGFDAKMVAEFKSKGYEPANIAGGTARKNRQAPASLFQPNQLGIVNMIGDVKEWCYDWHEENYQRNSPKRGPKSPDTGLYKVIKGISWRSALTQCVLRQTLIRDFTKDEFRNDVGF